MSVWHSHFFNSRHQLADMLDILSETISYAQNACEKVHRPVSLDLTVRGSNWPMPKALRVSGSAYGPGRIDLVIDTSASFESVELHQSLLRAIFHEFHHVLRWDGPGYGRTLGEALASEGLAQHFVHEMMDCPAEPWEQAIDETELLKAQLLALQRFEAENYDHSEWFFGAKELSQWTGYSVGYAMIAKYLVQAPDTTALACAAIPASEFKPFLP